MAGPKKKPRNPSKSGSEESENEESDSGTYLGQKEIQATFEGRNPESQDFHGIKQLLSQLFLKAHIDLSQLSDLLIAQNGIGSVLKQSYGDSDDEDEDVDMNDEKDVFGITSVISLTSSKNTPCIQQFYSLLEELGQKHADESVQNTIKNIVTQHRIGFLINERFVNIPAQISLPLFTSLSDEVDRMAKKYPYYDFEYYILICKTCRSKDNKDEEFFTNEEEEIFSKEADLTFDFCVANESDVGLGGKWLANDQQVIPYRRIVIFKADKLKNIVAKISTFVQSS
ncbi:protein BCCIP homolog [Diorhabda carinulata]|uniref:protein BCCIP homolog n=1 Tax=Diorhabda carinulata TaxID=1163345 RepID=UPI0025A1A46B|nr:protein BCCIP homolog [Diorhabda carinulata]